MKTELPRPSKAIHSLLALAAVVSSVLILGGIDALAALYASGGQLA